MYFIEICIFKKGFFVNILSRKNSDVSVTVVNIYVNLKKDHPSEDLHEKSTFKVLSKVQQLAMKYNLQKDGLYEIFPGKHLVPCFCSGGKI